MKFCKNCSAALEDDAVFCTECGASLADDNFTSNGSLGDQSGNLEGFQGSIPTPSDNSGNNSYSSNDNYSSNTNYNQPQQQYSAPQGKNPGTPWLIVSIIGFFCCGGVFAIPGLIFAIMATTSFNAGNIADAEQKANTAKWLSIGAIVLAVIVIILGFAFGVFATIQEGYY